MYIDAMLVLTSNTLTDKGDISGEEYGSYGKKCNESPANALNA